MMEHDGITDGLDHPTDCSSAQSLTVTALVRATRRQTGKPRCCIREGRPLETTTRALKNPPFSALPTPAPSPPAGSSTAPAAARRGRPGPAAAAADGGEGRCGAGGPPARLPPRHPGRAGRPPACLPASLGWVPGPSVLGRPSPSWIRGAAAAVARSHDDSSLEKQPVSAENLFQHRRYLKSGNRKDFLMVSKTVTAISYVNMDIIMISQYVYYKLKNQKMTKCSKNLKNFCVTWILLCVALCIVLFCQLLVRNQDQSSVLERSNASLDMIEMSGFICGYISCVFYLGSRFPQLYKNFQRRSTEGTSYLLFALAMLGNCTYGLSLVLKMPATKSFQALYFLHHLPWLIGSFGVLFLDILVTVQFVLYRQRKDRQPAVVALEVEPLLLGEDAA
ncbi:uncharacterized protein LOC118171539 isoform X1 [Oxyura jamaicensis]|uniref:uncharacterized protein LOC118171539 isoform X1 n=1 Tax=Oxyura jamaicensis TaxID=8884 RepID=UPI0015A5142E|nr:uncharacterized protein LOC118171539 isoform X1 [Oxyura jamaicensis]